MRSSFPDKFSQNATNKHKYPFSRVTPLGYQILSNYDWEWEVYSDSELQVSGPRDRPPPPNIYSKPSLHIISLTKRCNHVCKYCQVEIKYSNTPAPMSSESIDYLDSIVEFAMTNSPDALTVEFQGGETLLEWDVLKYLVERFIRLCSQHSKLVRFAIASNLTLLTDEIIEFCSNKPIFFSTSLDGLQTLHDKYRIYPNAANGAYNDVVSSIQRLRGAGINVGVITAVSADSIPYAVDIVDNFVDLRILSFFMKPVYPMGWATNAYEKIGCKGLEFGSFLKTVIERCIEYHDAEIPIIESFSAILLKKILGGYHTDFADLRSPCGALNIQIVYDTSGRIYTCDEARFGEGEPIGTTSDTLLNLQQNNLAKTILTCSETSSQVCGTCAYRPWCGRCPLMNLKEGLPLNAQSEETTYCKTMRGSFDAVFELLAENRTGVESYLRIVRLSQIIELRNENVKS